jgi:adenylyltransferase/sulfurtransferase
MLLYDALEMSFTTIKVRKNPNCPVCGVPKDQVELIDYEQFCGMPAHDHSNFTSSNGHENGNAMKTTNVKTLKSRLDAGEDLLVLDVRDPHEWAIASLDGTLRIPKGDIQAAKNAVLAGRKLREETVLTEIPQDREIIVQCRSGKRSAEVIGMLEEIGYNPNQLVNLEGGILAWARDIDQTMPSY